jgi:hypothetical protein
MNAPSFAIHRHDAAVISEIAKRAHQIFGDLTGRETMDFMMDITAVHANGCPLRLQALKDADDGNFAHDVMGIYRYLDRDTGKLTGEFLPRYAKN